MRIADEFISSICMLAICALTFGNASVAPTVSLTINLTSTTSLVPSSTTPQPTLWWTSAPPTRVCYPQGPCSYGYMDTTNGNSKYWSCGESCVGGKYRTDGGCNCACVSKYGCFSVEPTSWPSAPSPEPTSAAPTALTSSPTLDCASQYPCDYGYRDRTNGDYKYWSCGKGCVGGNYYTDSVCACACVAIDGCVDYPTATNAPSISSVDSESDDAQSPNSVVKSSRQTVSTLLTILSVVFVLCVGWCWIRKRKRARHYLPPVLPAVPAPVEGFNAQSPPQTEFPTITSNDVDTYTEETASAPPQIYAVVDKPEYVPQPLWG